MDLVPERKTNSLFPRSVSATLYLSACPPVGVSVCSIYIYIYIYIYIIHRDISYVCMCARMCARSYASHSHTVIGNHKTRLTLCRPKEAGRDSCTSTGMYTKVATTDTMMINLHDKSTSLGRSTYKLQQREVSSFFCCVPHQCKSARLNHYSDVIMGAIV